MFKQFFCLTISSDLCLSGVVGAGYQKQSNLQYGNKFEPLGTILPTPNAYRTASGAPGPKYWQQRADYDIKCNLDEKNQELTGTEAITYSNDSPDVLSYLWLQLDENEHSNRKNAGYQDGGSLSKQVGAQRLRDDPVKGN